MFCFILCITSTFGCFVATSKHPFLDADHTCISTIANHWQWAPKCTRIDLRGSKIPKKLRRYIPPHPCSDSVLHVHLLCSRVALRLTAEFGLLQACVCLHVCPPNLRMQPPPVHQNTLRAACCIYNITLTYQRFLKIIPSVVLTWKFTITLHNIQKVHKINYNSQ